MERNSLISERYLLRGAPNARDLGGLPTMDGRKVRTGLLLRSGELAGITDADAHTLSQYPLRTVIDFRTDLEREQKPDRVLAGVRYIHCPIVQQAAAIVSDGRVHVTYGQTPEPLYVRAIVSGGGEEAQAVIRGDYSCVTEILRNGAPVMQAEGRTHGAAVYPLVEYSVQELYETILSMEPESFRFLLEDARRNQEAVRRDLEDPELPLGRLLKQRISGQMTGPLAVSAEAQAYTAAAGEARMSGLNVTIMAIAGSGNHGITNFVGVLSAAEALGASEEQTATALAISSMITIYIKAHIKRMTAFCGCGVAAATGMTAAVSYLLGGSYDTAVHAMQTVLGTIGGMFCDGAKISCAYKLSTAASLAVQAAYLAREGCFVPAGVGIIGNTIEQTFANVGRLNDPGMVATDRELVAIIAENQRHMAGRS